MKEKRNMEWFNKQSNVVKFILLIIPFVGWVFELIVRWSLVVKKFSVLNLVMALVYTLIGWAWVLQLIDAILVLLGKNMLLVD